MPLKTCDDDEDNNCCAKDKKIAKMKCSRDLVGQLVIPAIKKNLNLLYVTEYPLTPVSLLLGTADGCVARTDKNALLKLLE